MQHEQVWNERAQSAADDLVRRWGRIEMAVILGSGWASAVEELGTDEGRVVTTTSLPGFEPTSVSGHPGRVRVVEAEGHRLLVFEGRHHYYERRDPFAVTHAVRVAIAAGARVVVLTNAAGAIDPAFTVGEPVVISDHINLTAASPFEAPPEHDCTHVYDPALIDVLLGGSSDLRTGIYAQFIGPQYESPAEIAMARTGGAQLAGMSTALEAVAAKGLGAKVLGISLVTNAAAGTPGADLDHQMVLAVGAGSARKVLSLLRQHVTELLDVAAR